MLNLILDITTMSEFFDPFVLVGSLIQLSRVVQCFPSGKIAKFPLQMYLYALFLIWFSFFLRGHLSVYDSILSLA